MNTFDSSIASISEEQLESFFEEIPDGTPNADKLLGGKKPEEQSVKKVKDDEVVNLESATSFGADIEKIEDVNALLGDDDEDEDKKETKKKADKKENVDDDSDKDDESKEDKKSKKSAPKKENEDTETPEELEAVNDILKNTVNYLVEKGLWLDWEGREDLEIDQKTYAEIAAKQDEARVGKLFDELIDSTGPYGKAIIGFVKQGGDPDAVIDIFKEQKQIENFDTSSEEGSKALINKYYKEILNWKPERIERHISTLIANDELETEISDVKESYDKYHQKELQQIAQQQQEETLKQKERESKFKENITSAIQELKDLPEKDKKLIEKSILNYNNKLSDGTQVSDFYVRFAQVQSNPKEYIDLVRFVMDKENYIKSLKTEINNKVVDKTFNFVKGNTALTTKKSSYVRVQRQDKMADFDFGIGKK